MKKTLHVIPHSHWDREWYQSFEAHRIKLVELFDAIIEEMENNEDYTYYHFDGQFVPVEDYLEIRPHMRDRLTKLVKENRIQIGPWYVLQDEFLTSGEANVRNMLYGLKLAREFGAEPVMTGYFPDAFGNMGQAPQICRGFGMDNAVFGRVCNPINSNHPLIKEKGITSSEIKWRSPDGSEVLGIIFAAWYNSAAELPSEPEALKNRILSIGRNLEKFSVSEHLLGMCGSDHQPLQKNLAYVIKLANQVQDEYTVKQSNFKDYVEQLRQCEAELPVFEGEINGQYSDGRGQLVSTASTHADIKRRNYFAQHNLERIAEPLSVFAATYGGKYDRDFFLYAWRKLMQNHPHDSICTCSCDEVYDAMMARFDSSLQVSDKLTESALEFLANAVDTKSGGDKSILVVSLEPQPSRVTVKSYVDFERDENVQSVKIFDEKGEPVPVKISVKRNHFTYTLPNDKFRQPKYIDRFELEFPVSSNGMGLRVYKVEKCEKAETTESLVKVFPRGMENENLSLTFGKNGTFDLTDKRTGRVYREQNRLEDQRDVGESYNFKIGGAPMYCGEANVYLDEITPFSATYKTVSRLPLGAVVNSYVTLTHGIDRVDIRSEIENEGENHRIRALFDSNVPTDTVLSEGQFDLVARPIEPAIVWDNPSNLQRTQAFVALEAESGEALAVANKGICEYEILRNGKNTVAVTLLRCVAEMGDWGVFPTPKAQCKGKYTQEYSLVPYAAENKTQAYLTAYDFAAPAVVARGTDCHSGIRTFASCVAFDNPAVHLTACKRCENRDTVILRFFNLTAEDQPLNISAVGFINAAFITNLDEVRQESLPVVNGKISMNVGPKKIVTVELVIG